MSGEICDLAGNCNAGIAAGPYKIDSGAPTLSPSVSPNPVLLNGSATASPNAIDATSGLASSNCAAVSTSTVGARTVGCTASDNAGNAANATASYTVTYDFSGFMSPVDGSGLNSARAGRTIPLTWRLLDAAGEPVTTLTGATVTAVALACDLNAPADEQTEVASGNSGLQNLGDGYYQFNWSTPKSYANSCKTVQLNLGFGVVGTAAFRFAR